jgi:hypothetical protein
MWVSLICEMDIWTPSMFSNSTFFISDNNKTVSMYSSRACKNIKGIWKKYMILKIKAPLASKNIGN